MRGIKSRKKAKRVGSVVWVLVGLVVAAIIGGVWFVSTRVLVRDETGTDTGVASQEPEKPQDTTPPVIDGAKNVSLYTGDTYDFLKDVTVSDDTDSEPRLTVDTSQVDFATIGSYKVIYTATDESGNEVSQTIKVKVAARDKVVYLTFDDGPSPYTADMLSILKEHDVRATFFVTGLGDDKVFKKIVKAGHAIGLHSNTHNYAIYRSEESFFADLEALSKRVEAQVGYAPKIMRFIGGSSNTVSRQYSIGIMTKLVSSVHDRGYKYYDWNCSTGDGGTITKQGEIDRVKGCSSQKTMYLLAHDTGSVTVAAMREIVPYLKKKGYDFQIITTQTPESMHVIAN